MGLMRNWFVTRGSSCVANLGSVAECLWKSRHLEISAEEREDFLGKSPLEEGIEGEVLVGEDDEPEGEFVAELFGFVADVTLDEEGRRPAAEEFEEMELRFGNSPAAGLCALFIVGVGEPGDRGDAENICERVFKIGCVADHGEGRQEEQKSEHGTESEAQFAAGKLFIEGRIHGAGATVAVVAYAEADEVADAWDPVAFEEITDVQEEAAAVVLEEAVAFLGVPFDDARGFFGCRHWVSYRRRDILT